MQDITIINRKSPSPVSCIPMQQFMGLLNYFMMCPEEVSGIGPVHQRGNGLFFVDDLFILEQTVTHVSTDIQKAVDKLIHKMVENNATSDEVAALKLWFHLHPSKTGVPLWSPQDEDVIESANRMGWSLNILGNGCGVIRIRLDMYQPFRYTWHDIPLYVVIPQDEQLIQHCAEEIRNKVRFSVPQNLLGRILRRKPKLEPVTPKSWVPDLVIPANDIATNMDLPIEIVVGGEIQ